MKLYNLKKAIDLIVELNDYVLDDDFNVGHDIICLPIPQHTSHIMINEELKELGFFIDEEEDCIKGFV